MRSHANTRDSGYAILHGARTGRRLARRWRRCRCVQSRRDFIPNADRPSACFRRDTDGSAAPRRRANTQASEPDKSLCSPGSGDDLLKVSRERTGVALFLGRCAGRRSRTLLGRAHRCRAEPSWPNKPYGALDAGAIRPRRGWPRLLVALVVSLSAIVWRGAYSPAAKRPRRAPV